MARERTEGKFEGGRFPYNLYDLFGYLLPGILVSVILLFSVDLAKVLDRVFWDRQPLQGSGIGKSLLLPSFIDFVNRSPYFLIALLIALSYIVGHALSAWSSFLIERVFVGKFIGAPTRVLLKLHTKRDATSKGIIARIFRRYLWPYSESFRLELGKMFVRIIKIDSTDAKDESDFYWLTASYLNQNSPSAHSLVMHFLNLYGFSRNISLAFLVGSLIFLPLSCVLNLPALSILGWVYLAMAVALFWNYMKMYKRHADELFRSFYTYVRAYDTGTHPSIQHQYNFTASHDQAVNVEIKHPSPPISSGTPLPTSQALTTSDTA